MATATFTGGLRTDAETLIHYVIYDDGSTGSFETDDLEKGEPELHRPGRIVTEAVYKKQLAKLRKAHDELVAGLRAADEARLLEDYDALLAAGIPEATARRLSGHEDQGS